MSFLFISEVNGVSFLDSRETLKKNGITGVYIVTFRYIRRHENV